MIKITDGWSVNEIEPVQYVDKMGSDQEVCNAARVSFDKNASNYTDEENTKLINYLHKNDHWSPFSHCYMKFRFNAPMFIARQFQKHVVGFAWNEVSRRYVSNPPMFFVPKSWRKRPPNMKQGSILKGQVPLKGEILNNYVGQMQEHARDYKHMLEQGICPEQARMCMPQSMMTQWIWSGSVAAWARFINLRSDSHAQIECHQYAAAVKVYLESHFPECAKVL
tara:strand:- start:1663 stop:2331 length:669 start_codon:yes stop_codon:yes gene_type:complete